MNSRWYGSPGTTACCCSSSALSNRLFFPDLLAEERFELLGRGLAVVGKLVAFDFGVTVAGEGPVSVELASLEGGTLELGSERGLAVFRDDLKAFLCAMACGYFAGVGFASYMPSITGRFLQKAGTNGVYILSSHVG